jgi:hypothetical protein
VEAKGEERRKVRSLVADEHTRSVLDRLSLVGSAVQLPIVTAIAEVQPTVDRPGERLQELVGPWIQTVRAQRYMVPPLLDGAATDYLSNEIKRGANTAVSHVYLAPRRLGPQDAFQLCFDCSPRRSISLERWSTRKCSSRSKMQTKRACEFGLGPSYGDLRGPDPERRETR